MISFKNPLLKSQQAEFAIAIQLGTVQRRNVLAG
jgi:hypothetical protein